MTTHGLQLRIKPYFGMVRACIAFDGRPHFYAEGLRLDPSPTRLGMRSFARLRAQSGGLGFLQLCDGTEAILDAPKSINNDLCEGDLIEVEIIAEARPRKQKSTRARFIAKASNDEAPRCLSAPYDPIADMKLRASLIWGEGALTLEASDSDDDLLETAREQALLIEGALPSGGLLSIEATRAFVACDVDQARATQSQDAQAKRLHHKVNTEAIDDLPRRLRLTGLAGLVIIDLIGDRFDQKLYLNRLKSAFGPEAPTIMFGYPGRFGTLEFTKPWGPCPLSQVDRVMTLSSDLLHRAHDFGTAEPGRMITIKAPMPVIEFIRERLKQCLDPMVARVRLSISDQEEVILS